MLTVHTFYNAIADDCACTALPQRTKKIYHTENDMITFSVARPRLVAAWLTRRPVELDLIGLFKSQGRSKCSCIYVI